MESKTSSEVVAEICLNHYGHEIDREHLRCLRLPQLERQKLAGRIISGVPLSRILDDVILSCDDGSSSDTEDLFEPFNPDQSKIDSQLTLLNLLTSRQLRSMAQRSGVKGNLHSSDPESVTLKLEEEKQRDPGVVLFFKPQEESSQISFLEDNDMVLIIQTSDQREMLKKFGKIICIDSTHNTNKYKFLLYSIVVICPFGKGYPVAHMITNKPESQDIVTLFFAKVAEALGDSVQELHTRWLMSDNTPIFFNAFKEVFPSNPTWLMCLWHVKQCWLRKSTKIQDADIRVSETQL